MEQRNENPVFGRKVFFITPPLNVENYVIEGLREMEYEVYTIKDYKQAKYILKGNKDALCFMFIDTAMSYESWYKFIKTFEMDSVLKTVFIGLLSQDISEKKHNFFLLNTNLPGGFTLINISLDSLLGHIQNILDLNGAKGRRKFLRLNCNDNKRISGYMTAGTKLFPIEIENISTSGIAIKTSPVMAQVLIKDKDFRNLSLTIDHATFVIKGKVFDTKIADGKCHSVLLLDNYLPREKKAILEFIFSEYDKKMEGDLSTALLDTTNYEEYVLPEGFTPFMSESVPAPQGPIRQTIETQVINDSEGVSDLENLDELEFFEDDEDSGSLLVDSSDTSIL